MIFQNQTGQPPSYRCFDPSHGSITARYLEKVDEMVWASEASVSLLNMGFKCEFHIHKYESLMPFVPNHVFNTTISCDEPGIASTKSDVRNTPNPLPSPS